MIFFGEPDIGVEECRAVNSVLLSKWIGFGEQSQAFEKELVNYLGVKNGALLSSCTAALHLALILKGVRPGDEIITTPLTFAATTNVILYLNARPVFVDIRADTLNIDEDLIEKAITRKTRGILVVHFGGLPCNMNVINKIAKKNNLFVIEDAAHAFGAKIDGRMVGNSNNLTCFSFYANKNLTSVEGGLLTSSNSKEIEKAKLLRLHGLNSDAWKRFKDRNILVTEVTELGYKYNINDVQSAIGRVQLKKFDRNLRKRQKYARIYDSIFSKIPGVYLQPKPDGEIRHALHLYTIVIDPQRFIVSRDEIVWELRKRGIFAVVHYQPIHLHKMYREKFGYKKGNFKIAERVSENIFTLPLLPQLSISQTKWIAETTKRLLLKFKK